MNDLDAGAARAGVTIRPLLAKDAAAAAAAARTALERRYPEELTLEQEATWIAVGTERVAHLQRTDPGGCWIAEIDGQIAGVAIGLVREGVWGLSLLAVLPDFQGRGIGTSVYAHAVAYGADEPGGIILSSSHPAAMRRYARSPGYRLLPTVGFSGTWDPRRVPAALRCRPGDLAADAQTIDDVSRHVRGASHMRDLPTLLDRPGSALLIIEDEGFACAGNGSPWLLAARTDAAAEDLLWGAISSGPRGGTVSYDFVTAENQWAIRVGLEAGLAVAPDGPMFVRGRVGPMATRSRHSSTRSNHSSHPRPVRRRIAPRADEALERLLPGHLVLLSTRRHRDSRSRRPTGKGNMGPASRGLEPPLPPLQAPRATPATWTRKHPAARRRVEPGRGHRVGVRNSEQASQGDPMLTAIADSGSFTVGPSPALVIVTIVMLVSAYAGVVTAMKGLWFWLVIGLVTSGLVWWYSAFLPPKPGSPWARRIARRRRSGTA